MKTVKTIAALATLVAFTSIYASAAWADCSLNGKSYPTGTKVGGLECKPDGKWRPG